MATDKRTTEGSTTATAVAKTLTDEQMATRLDELSGKAQRGDMKAWTMLKPILEKIRNWETTYPTPAEHARRSLLEATTGSNPVVAEAWERRVRTMITELAGTNPTPLERMLCERVATCWLDMSLADLVYASRMKDSISLEAGDYYQRMKDRAHKRHLSAMLTLARVRRLLAPVVAQVNIAQPGAQQLNVAAPANGPALSGNERK